MTFFNKKNNLPALYYTLDKMLEEAKNKQKNNFYYSLLDGEHDLAMAWAIKNRILMEVSHKNGNTLVYKFSGF